MQKIIFYKYEGAGNDFIMINNLDGRIKLTQETIAQLCNRHFGVGSDGLILLSKAKDYDFNMIYHNADGSIAQMCGNGSRCAVAFAKHLKIISNHTSFLVGDMVFRADINNDSSITVYMPNEYELIEKNHKEYFLTISKVPHVVKFSYGLSDLDILQDARQTRYSEKFINTNGTNVNYVEKLSHGQLYVRTYERGVEAETLACGTGIIASTLAIADSENLNGAVNFEVKSQGGTLIISFNKHNNLFNNIIMNGQARLVFTGETTLT